MNRRSFIKRVGVLVGLSYAAPLSLIPDIQICKLSSGNTFVSPSVIAKEALEHLEFSLQFIHPAMRQLADNVDSHIYEVLKEGKR